MHHRADGPSLRVSRCGSPPRGLGPEGTMGRGTNGAEPDQSVCIRELFVPAGQKGKFEGRNVQILLLNLYKYE